MTIWRATVDMPPMPFTDEQREAIVQTLPGFPTMTDGPAGVQVDFDVEADSRGQAIGRGSRLFSSALTKAIGPQSMQDLRIDVAEVDE